MKVYIAGPITGIPNRNAEAFDRAAAEFRAAGHEVVNPLEVNPPGSCESWADAMRKDIPHLLTCDRIHLLRGWQASKGASLEAYIASKVGIRPVFPGEIA